MKYQAIAVMGKNHDIMGFKAAGLEILPVENAKDAKFTLHKISQKGYAVIFLTEDLAAELAETLQRYKTKTYPAIIPIPTAKGSQGLGMKGIRQDADKVIGADILFR